MRIRFTTHARLRMRLRGVSEEMVVQTLENPQEISEGYYQRHLAYCEFSGLGRLKVVYAQQREDILVITVIWD